MLRGSHRSAQADVDRLKVWSDKWITEFNAKEKIPGTENHNQKRIYTPKTSKGLSSERNTLR